MLEGEMLVGEVYKKCHQWSVWEQVCDLMQSCLTGAIKDRFYVRSNDEFLFFLFEKFPDKIHRIWSNVEIVRESLQKY